MKPTIALVALLALLSVKASQMPQGTAAEAPARPNFVVLVVDDLSNQMLASSGLRESVTSGVSFTRALAPTPLCCPARATILTGRYAHGHGVRSNAYRPEKNQWGAERRFRERGLETRTVAHLLEQSGYTTSLMGRYMNGYGTNDGGPSGTDPEAPPDEPDEEGSHRLRVPPGWTDWRVGLNVNGVSVPPRDEYRTDYLRGSATAFIRDRAGSRQPYFLYLADGIPHREVAPAERHEHAHDGAPLPKPPSYNEADTSDKPGYIARDNPLPGAGVRPADCADDDWPIAYPTRDVRCTYSEDYLQHTWESGLEGLESIRELYDELLATLRDTRQLDNTYLIFVSDNGVHIGEHRQSYGKSTPYIEDLGVPLTVLGPRVAAKAARSHLVGLQDIAPTIIDLAGIAVPPQMDGRSLSPLLGSAPLPRSEWRKRMLIEGFPGPAVDLPRHRPGDTPRWRGLLGASGEKYVEYPTTGEREYYDLRTDPFELVNRVTSLPPPTRDRLRLQLQRLTQCSGSSTCGAAEGFASP